MLIEINNNKCRLDLGFKDMKALDKAFAMRVKGAFYSPAFRNGTWDGKKHFLTESGYFKTGLLPQVVKFCEEELGKTKFTFAESRDTKVKRLKVKNITDIKLRGYQLEAVKAVTTNKVGGVYFPRGIIDASTNAGKTYIAAGLYYAFKKQPTILLLNNSTLFDQFKTELVELLGDDFGYVQGKEIHWGNFTMAMVPTLNSKLKDHRFLTKLAQFKTVLVDECHLSTSKSYSNVLFKLFNTVVRVGLSGSPLKHKDKIKNQTVKEFFGDVIYTIKSKELEDLGYSSPVTCKILTGNTDADFPKNYPAEYDHGIVSNIKRNKRIWKTVERCASKDIMPFLIIVQRHQHIKNLLDLCPKHLKADYVIKFIHHEVKARNAILDEFKAGTVDILISSMIIKIGQNMPLLKAGMNAGGGDSDINTLQLLGRHKRKHKSKKRTYYYDFYDEGSYLRRHSKHRIKAIKAEGHTVKELYKRKSI